MADISTWSPIAANNTAAPPDGYPELMAASAVNDTDRETMAAIRRQAERGGWFDWGLAVTFVSGTQFSVPGDQTAVYQAGRRVQAYGPGWTELGTVTSSSYTSSTTVTLAMDSGVLQSDIQRVEVGVEAGTVREAPTFDSGTVLWFYQPAAPTGWTLVPGLTGAHTLQVSDAGTGGTASGAGDAAEWQVTGLSVATAASISGSTDLHSITLAQTAQHTHTVRLRGGAVGETGLKYLQDDPSIAAQKLIITDDVVGDPDGAQGATQQAGTGQGHSHGLASATVSLDNGSVTSTGAWRTPSRFGILCSKD